MHRIDNSKFLLYIEPTVDQKSKEPVNDEITKIVAQCLKNSKPGTANYRNIESDGVHEADNAWKGTHTTDCGERSDNKDHLLMNGMITNSLCVFYLQYYRDAIPSSEMSKVNDLCSYAVKNCILY